MKTELEKTHEHMKAWNDRRAGIEKEALDKFYALKRLFDADKKIIKTKNHIK